MTIKVNAMGDACPIPVVKTQKAMQELTGAGTVETLVDNETAVQNLGKLAASKGCTSGGAERRVLHLRQAEDGRGAVV